MFEVSTSLILVGVLIPYWMACTVYCFKVLADEKVQTNVLQVLFVIPLSTLMAPLFFVQVQAFKRRR